MALWYTETFDNAMALKLDLIMPWYPNAKNPEPLCIEFPDWCHSAVVELLAVLRVALIGGIPSVNGAALSAGPNMAEATKTKSTVRIHHTQRLISIGFNRRI